jgi:acetolactate synthase-1/2/3 large subunit
MAEAKRPVLYIGGGVILSGAAAELKQVAEAMSIPVTATLMGLGGFPGTHPKLWMGMLGMHGTYYANMAVANSDVLIAVGARFDDRVTGRLDTFAPHAKIIHIDIDPTSISKNVKVDIPIVGDCKDALTKLAGFIKADKRTKAHWAKLHAPWLADINGWKKDYPLSYKQEGDEIKPQFVVEKIYELTKGEAIISTEVGQNQMWAAQFYRFNHPRTFLSSGGLGCMGYGFPAALGAQVACPDRTVIDIAGDGSIQMNIQELATAVQYKLPVKVCILNNGFLGMVRQWQELFYGKRYSGTCLDCGPDFVKLAEAYGALGLRATKPSEVEGVIKEALKAKTCVFIDFHVSKEEGVYPMVPAGRAMTDMLLA